MACINPNDPEFKKILKQVGGNPLLAAIEFNKLYPEEGAVESEVIKPGVAELFESNPELANAVYEALGIYNVWHASDKKIDKFISENVEGYFAKVKKGSPKAVFFTADKAPQESFLSKREYQEQFAVKMNNPLVVDTKTGYSRDNESFKELVDRALAGNHDGVIVKNVDDNGFVGDVYISLNANQISKITPQQKQQVLQLYSQYLNTIFPDSKVKDIVYHVNKTGTVSPQDGKAFYSTSLGSWLIELEEMKGNRNPVLINITNPTEVSSEYEFTDKAQKFRESGLGDEYVTPDEVRKKGTDSVIGRDSGQGINEKTYVTYNSSQVYQLGTKQDIEGFKEFVDKSTFKQLELDPEMSNYIADQISKAFNVPIPGMEKDTLITAEEIENFNRDVENRDGRLPSEYFTGIDDVNKWVLNKSELYDLVDKDTGEIYLKDVNLSTGQVEKQDKPSQPVPDKERQEAIDYLNNAVKDFRIDEILAERGYDVNDIISNLASAENKEEFDKIINKLLRLLC